MKRWLMLFREYGKVSNSPFLRIISRRRRGRRGCRCIRSLCLRQIRCSNPDRCSITWSHRSWGYREAPTLRPLSTRGIPLRSHTHHHHTRFRTSTRIPWPLTKAPSPGLRRRATVSLATRTWTSISLGPRCMAPDPCLRPLSRITRGTTRSRISGRQGTKR
jgi:hypothetical protein